MFYVLEFEIGILVLNTCIDIAGDAAVQAAFTLKPCA